MTQLIDSKHEGIKERSTDSSMDAFDRLRSKGVGLLEDSMERKVWIPQEGLAVLKYKKDLATPRTVVNNVKQSFRPLRTEGYICSHD